MAAEAKYDRIGVNYDTSRRADPYILSRLLHHLAPINGKSYLDVACGSGNYTSAMASKAGNWSAIDQSDVMLSKARSKSAEVEWMKADAGNLPFTKGSFDGVTCTLAIHHFPSLRGAFGEIRRVLSDGRFVLFTSTTEQMKGYWLTEYFPVAMDRSWDQMPSRVEIEAALDVAGFKIEELEPYAVAEDLGDFFLYSGKHRPEMYLDPMVRRGISTFSSLADPAEIEAGCRVLERDINSGRIKKVIAEYDNDLGDYCFFVSS
ncbi:MAG: class I SAM-dependent methyltransferase [Pyrinomonadaceae bacterium]|nr:class I SAM-dependent methyltransferase [Pyrinomonadaceae bacterium]